MQLKYRRIEHNTILELFENHAEFRSSLAYMVDFHEHQNLTVISRDFSIEISNADITIILVLMIGFEMEEFYEIANKNNVHIISFNRMVKVAIELKDINIKVIDSNSLFYTILARTKNNYLIDLTALKKMS